MWNHPFHDCDSSTIDLSRKCQDQGEDDWSQQHPCRGSLLLQNVRQDQFICRFYRVYLTLFWYYCLYSTDNASLVNISVKTVYCVCVCVLLLCIVLCYSVEMLAKSLMTECCLLLPWLSSIFMSWLTVVAISCCRAFLRKRLQLRNSRAAGWLSDAETNNTVTFSACNQWGMFWWCPCDVSVPSCPLRVTREA